MKQLDYVIDGNRYTVEVLSVAEKNAEVMVNGKTYSVEIPGASPASTTPASTAPVSTNPVSTTPSTPAPTETVSRNPGQPEDQGNQIYSPMPGTIASVAVEEGQAVKRGETLLILEAMKMENEVPAVRDGTVKKIHVARGTEVGAGTLLVELQ